MICNRKARFRLTERKKAIRSVFSETGTFNRNFTGMECGATGIVQIIQVFVSKGIPIGTSLAFMMAVVGLSIPEAMLLTKVMTVKLITIFFGIVTLCIIISGYFFNWIL